MAVDTPTNGQVAAYQSSSGKFEWVDNGSGGDTYTIAAAQSGSDAEIQLDATAGTDSAVKLAAGSNITLTESGGDTITIDSTQAVDGSGAANQVTYWSDSDTITGSTKFTIDATAGDITATGQITAGDYILAGGGQNEYALTSSGESITITPSLGVNTGSISISEAADGDISITPDGTGKIQLDGLAWPNTDGSADQVLATDGAGTLSFTDAGGGGTPAGSDREIQFNDNGSFGAVSAFKIGSSNTIGIGTSPSSAYSLKTLSNIQSLGTVDASSVKGTNGGSATQPTFKYSNNNTGLFFSATDQIDLTMGGSNKLSFGSAGEILIGGTDAGTSGQVLTSGGSGSAMSWATAGGGGGINWPNSLDTYTGTFGYGDNLGIGFNGKLSTQSPTSAQWANGTIRYRPWICMKEGNLANWYIWCADLPTGGSNQTWTVGLWNVGTDNVPGTLKCTSTIIISSSTGILSGTWTAETGQDLGVKVGDTYWVGYYSTYGSSATSASMYWFTGAQITGFPGRRPNSNTGNTSDPCRVYGSSGDIATIGDNPTITGADTQTTSGWPVMWYTVS
tara:strand:+ start:202 stop:1893 length:1692 start_codon:yes stop_codon:yes gene_type:complete